MKKNVRPPYGVGVRRSFPPPLALKNVRPPYGVGVGVRRSSPPSGEVTFFSNEKKLRLPAPPSLGVRRQSPEAYSCEVFFRMKKKRKLRLPRSTE